MPKNFKSKRKERREVKQIMNRAKGNFGMDDGSPKEINDLNFLEDQIIKNDLEERYLENKDIKFTKTKRNHGKHES